MRGFLLGSLALIAVEAFVRNAEGTGALVDFVGEAVQRFLSPNVAAVPNFAARKATPSTPAAAASSTASATVNPTRAAFVATG